MRKNVNINTRINRFFLGFLALVSCQYTLANSLEGRWEHAGQQTSIRASNHSNLLLCNEQGDCAEGLYRGKGVVFVPKWNVNGAINRSKTRISWSNGTQWTRFKAAHRPGFNIQFGQTPIAGPWIHQGRPTTIQMQRDGIHFTLINEEGQVSRGMVNRDGELVLPELRIRGVLHKHGKLIKWSNGTIWHRP